MVSLPLRGLVSSEFSYLSFGMYSYITDLTLLPILPLLLALLLEAVGLGSFLDCIGSQCRKNSERTRARLSTSHASFLAQLLL
jgi:hypothetical protein